MGKDNQSEYKKGEAPRSNNKDDELVQEVLAMLTSRKCPLGH